MDQANDTDHTESASVTQRDTDEDFRSEVIDRPSTPAAWDTGHEGELQRKDTQIFIQKVTRCTIGVDRLRSGV